MTLPRTLQAGEPSTLVEANALKLWATRAACLRADPELFFPEDGDNADEARRICLGCPVREVCLAVALARKERHGIWGGLTPEERRAARRLRASGVV